MVIYGAGTGSEIILITTQINLSVCINTSISHLFLVNQHLTANNLNSSYYQVDGNYKRDDSRVSTHQVPWSSDPLSLSDLSHAQHSEDSRGIQVKVWRHVLPTRSVGGAAWRALWSTRTEQEKRFDVQTTSLQGKLNNCNMYILALLSCSIVALCHRNDIKWAC